MPELKLNTVIYDLWGQPVQIQDLKEPVTKVQIEGKDTFKEIPNYRDMTLRDALIVGLDKHNNSAKEDIDADLDMYEIIEKAIAAESTIEVSPTQHKQIRNDLGKYWGQFGRGKMGAVIKAFQA